MWLPNSLLRALLLTALLVLPLAAEERSLVILHTNDIHGYIESYEGGGLERIAALVQRYREEYPGQVVLLDGGDTSLGTLLSGSFQGKPTAEMMALMNYDAITLGNHEFNWGQDAMRRLTDEMKTSVLCANLVTQDGSPAPYPSYTVVERNGVRIGVLGLVTPDTPRRAPVEFTRGWQFLSASAGARAAIAEMPDTDIVLALDHIGVEADVALAREVPEIDMIVGGHSHTALQQVVLQAGTPIVQAGCYGKYLGVAKVTVDTDSNTLTLKHYELVAANSVESPDPQAHNVVKKYAAELRPLLEKTVAEVREPLSKAPGKNGYDTPLGNFISDVFREQAGSDIALYNRGGVRFDMPSGPLTVAGVFELFPFDDPVVVLEATGAQLVQIVEQGTVDGEGPLSSSGITAVLTNGKATRVEVHGSAVVEDRVYTLATTNFLSGGGDGMGTLASLPRKRTLDFTREVLMDYLKKHPVVTSPGVGRLSESSSGWFLPE